jgi:hypothetical protein
VTRDQYEWRIATEAGEDPLANDLRIAEVVGQGPDDTVETKRFALRNDHNIVRLVPALADRPVIVKTDRPLYIPAGEEATLFVGSPLWIAVHVGARFTRVLDVAIFQPSDTWFGPDTLSGELCYASRTTARLKLANLPFRPHRAVSAARIRNKATSNLLLEKLKVPVQNLSLYASAEGHLWTEGLTLEREEDTDAANVRLDKRPSRSDAVTLVSAPREKVSKGFLLDAFGGLLPKKAQKIDERIPRKPGVSSDTNA